MFGFEEGCCCIDCDLSAEECKFGALTGPRVLNVASRSQHQPNAIQQHNLSNPGVVAFLQTQRITDINFAKHQTPHAGHFLVGGLLKIQIETEDSNRNNLVFVCNHQQRECVATQESIFVSVLVSTFINAQGEKTEGILNLSTWCLCTCSFIVTKSKVKLCRSTAEHCLCCDFMLTGATALT